MLVFSSENPVVFLDASAGQTPVFVWQNEWFQEGPSPFTSIFFFLRVELGSVLPKGLA